MLWLFVRTIIFLCNCTCNTAQETSRTFQDNDLNFINKKLLWNDNNPSYVTMRSDNLFSFTGQFSVVFTVVSPEQINRVGLLCYIYLLQSCADLGPVNLRPFVFTALILQVYYIKEIINYSIQEICSTISFRHRILDCHFLVPSGL